MYLVFVLYKVYSKARRDASNVSGSTVAIHQSRSGVLQITGPKFGLLYESGAATGAVTIRTHDTASVRLILSA